MPTNKKVCHSPSYEADRFRYAAIANNVFHKSPASGFVLVACNNKVGHSLHGILLMPV